ncbi:hypothetical protein Tco_1239364 [Tanacetum coccineum]
MDDPNITMKEYIRLEEEKAQRHGQTFNWQTATYGMMEYCEEEDDSLTNFETEYPAIVFDDTSDAALSYEPMSEFPAITYNDDLTSKFTEPSVSFQNIEEFDLNKETLLSKHDEEERNVLDFNDSFSLNIVFPNELKSKKDIDDDEIDVTRSSGRNVINIDTKRSDKLLKTGHGKIRKVFNGQGTRYEDRCRYGSDLEHGPCGLQTSRINSYRTCLGKTRGERRAELAAEDTPAVDEGAQADPAPLQAPQPLPPALWTMQQRISRLEDEVQELRRSIVRLQGDVDRSITDQGRFTTWMVSCMTQLVDASGHTYQAFHSTLVGSSQLPYQRRTRRRTGDASTSAPQQPDP